MVQGTRNGSQKNGPVSCPEKVRTLLFKSVPSGDVPAHNCVKAPNETGASKNLF
jgi:hypothetical protein